MTDAIHWGIAALLFVVAVLYSSVGHGGASGYLAVLSFFGIAPAEMATTALILNILVAGLSFTAFYRGGYFSWKLTWPFVLASIPTAFLGGLLMVGAHTYYLLLAAVLSYAAWRMWLGSGKPPENAVSQTSLRLPEALAWGTGIGLLSGLIGVGGGIFLSPLMLMRRWADVKTTAATSAFFIVVNAMAGLLGRQARHGLVIGNLWPWLLAGLLGGLVGSYLGARHCRDSTLRRVLAIVLLLAAGKLVLHSGLC